MSILGDLTKVEANYNHQYIEFLLFIEYLINVFTMHTVFYTVNRPEN